MTGGPVPDALLAFVAFATIGTHMFRLGLAVGPGEYLAAWRDPGLMLRGVFCNVVAFPVIALAVARVFDLPVAAEVGMMIMAVSPGAPIALRRSLRAGGDAGFAIALQVTLAAVAVVSLPLTIELLDKHYGAEAQVSAASIAKQVFVGQLLPFLLGCGARRLLGARRPRVEPGVSALATVLLLLFVALVLLNFWTPIGATTVRVAAAIAVATACALALGHAMGGPAAATRTTLAIGTAARNAGLALLVVSVNHMPATVQAAVLAYLLLAALAITPYVIWRRTGSARIRAA